MGDSSGGGIRPPRHECRDRKDEDVTYGVITLLIVTIIVLFLGIWFGAMIGYAAALAGNGPPEGFCTVFVAEVCGDVK